jgi:hypothetical protein
VTPAEYREHLTRLLDEVHADGARVLVVVPPRTAWAESQRPELRELDRIVREAGAGPATAVLEPRDARQGTNGGSAPIGHWYVDESRLSSDGTIRYAEAVGVRLRELRWFEPASR